MRQVPARDVRNAAPSTAFPSRPSANLDAVSAPRELQQALNFLNTQTEALDALATDRANALLADHRRVREAARDIGQYAVRASLPVDVLGVYVLLPAVL